MRTPVNCGGCSERFRLLASASLRRSFFGFGSSQADQPAHQEEIDFDLAGASAAAAVSGYEHERERWTAEALERPDPLHEQLDEGGGVDAAAFVELLVERVGSL